VRLGHPWRWISRLVSRITWTHITRVAGLLALGYEVLVQQADRPSLMIVIGAMILGTEAFMRDRRFLTDSKRRDSSDDGSE
jgi:hypothetical protein